MQTQERVTNIVDEVKQQSLSERTKEVIALLRAWREEGDAEEQRETGTFLLQALAEHPVSIDEHHE
jgi:hypothetical protein